MARPVLMTATATSRLLLFRHGRRECSIAEIGDQYCPRHYQDLLESSRHETSL